VSRIASGVLIDDKGRSWPDRSWELARRLAYRHPTLDLATYAVRELGFIHLRPQDSGVRVALRAGRFGLEALGGALYELRDGGWRRIILAIFGEEEWRYEILADAWEFADRAESLIAGGPVELRHPWLAMERDIGALSLPTFAQVRPLVELWRSARGRLPADVQAAVASSGLLHRMILVRRRPRSANLVFAYFGAGIECRPPGESERLIDREVNDHHDREYGAWVASAYAEALQRNYPHLRSIRATIRVSDATVARGRYDRLILPWRGRGGESFAMGISLTRDHRCLDARG
jgi:hypothetical protein